jgi:Flp pilus assembly pilin Flp
MIRNFWKDEQGQDLIEYSLLLAFLCLFGTASYSAINGSLTTIWGNAKTAAASAATTSGT